MPTATRDGAVILGYAACCRDRKPSETADPALCLLPDGELTGQDDHVLGCDR
jgi:hypothetical protein